MILLIGYRVMAYITRLIFFCLILRTIDAKDCLSENGIHLFGAKCDFMCHCKNNDNCDVTSGECVSGCDRGWFGPGCQYRDIVAHGHVQDVGQNAGSVIDGDLGTCSDVKTNWKIYFNTTETITEIHIVTKPDQLHLFKNFIVFVEHMGTRRECYRHGKEAPRSEVIVLVCNERLIGNQVTIQLERLQTKLVLCEVKINGGRNLAFKQDASQTSVNSHCAETCTAQKAVDGNNKVISWTECSFTDNEDNPWWMVDLGYEARIRKVQAVTVKDERPSAIEVSNVTDASQMDANDIDDIDENVGVNAIGRFIKVTREGSLIRIMLCELYVFGDCLEDKCGYDCKKTCHCQKATIQDKMSGLCSNGCNDGWKGPQCDVLKETEVKTECNRGMYGRNCQEICNVNCIGNQHGVCNKTDGRCLGGCKDGWKGDMCDRTCPFGWYGTNCDKLCNYQCKGEGRSCNPVTGYCLHGCQPGWTGNLCNEACRPGYFGTTCSQRCSSKCRGRNAMCSIINGSCLNGCQAGWRGKQCDTECSDGTYGMDCSKQCPSNCKNDVCDKVNGNCFECKPGYRGDTCTYISTKPSVPVFSNVVSTNYCTPKECLVANLNEEVMVECFVKGGSTPIDLNMLMNGQAITDATKTQKEINTITHTYVNYSLTPTESDVENGVLLTCTVKNPALSNISSSSILLYVKVHPEKIEVNQFDVVEGKRSEIQCIETNVRPPLKAKLIIDTTEELNTSMEAEIKSNNLYTVTTSTTKSFDRFQNRVSVMCCSTVDNQMCERSKLNVLFPPHYITVEEFSKKSQENGDSIVRVRIFVSESNPKSSVKLVGVKQTPRALVAESFEHKTNGTHGWTHSETWSFNFTREDNKREIKIEAVTKGFPDQILHYIYKINVTYYPIVTILGQSTVYYGDDVILACHVNSNPPSTISWYNQTDLIEETYGVEKFNLSLRKISVNVSKIYICMANNGIGVMKSKIITLIVKDPPERKESKQMKSWTESSIVSVLAPVIGCIIAVLIITMAVGFLIQRRGRRNSSLDSRNIIQRNNEEQRPDIGNRNNGFTSARQGEHEMDLMHPISTIEPNVYSEIGSDFTYQSLSHQSASKESDLYTELECQPSTATPCYYNNVTP